MNKTIKLYVLPNNKKFLSLIKKVFKGEIIANKKTGYLCLTVVFPREYFGRFVETFATAAVEWFKFNYLNENILLTELPPEQRLALIKALTQFDCDLDKQLISSRLQKVEKTIYVESFLAFYAPEFYARLNELCALANNNKAELVMSETFNELFKFILSNLNFNGSEVIICKKYNYIIIYNIKGKELTKIDEESELNLILKLVEILPRKIIIKVPKTESPALSLVCKLFSQYVEFNN